MNSTIKDPDLYRLFQNSFPNTLDTAVKWKGYAAGSSEELTFVITGDIKAMWLRDSANQMQSYLHLLKPSTANNSLASLYRGVINLQSRYVTSFPFCNSFQPPVESGQPPIAATSQDRVFPSYNATVVHECKFELDSLAAFLEISWNYFSATNDTSFFAKYNWVSAIQAVLNTTQAMMTPTYGSDGSVLASPYTFERNATVASDTLDNNGLGNPNQNGTGLIRSAFRPSDDACIYQFFIPANMMFSHYLGMCAKIMASIPNQSSLAAEMSSLSSSLRNAIEKLGVVDHPKYGKIYAYEVDGYGGQNIMDDANIPSLLSAPVIGYLNITDQTYQNTRQLILSASNPYYMRGPVINAVGGPHDGPGRAWPLASIVRILTSNDDDEIFATLKELVASTDGLGLIHESVDSFQASSYTRPW